MSTLLAFLGGAGGRMIWGELTHWWTARSEHKHELERLEQQERFNAAQHARNLEAIKAQAELGVKTIQVQADADVDRVSYGAWADAVVSVGRQTGVHWLDMWNGSIRPAVATWSIVMLSISEFGMLEMSENMQQIAGAALGIYLAERGLFKRGKR